MTELFSITNNEVKSLGTGVVFCKHSLPKDSQELKVVPEIAFCRKDGAVNIIGAFIWRGGTLGDLWDTQSRTLQFILDNADMVG
jgi:hypothetical protein